MARSKAARAAAALLLTMAAGAARAGDLEDFYENLTGSLGSQALAFQVQAQGPGGQTFTGFMDGRFDPTQALANASRDTLGRLQDSFPIASTVAGFTFQFDPALNVFVRSTEGLGPILSERANTTGKGKLNVAAAYSYVEFDVFEGDDLDDLPVSLGSTKPAAFLGGGLVQGTNPSNGFGFSFPRPFLTGNQSPLTFQMLASGATSLPRNAFAFGNVNVGSWSVFAQLPKVELDTSIEAQVFALFLNYGITDRFDVGLVIPLLNLELEGEMRATGLVDDFTSKNPILYGGSVTSDSESAGGLGDVVVRAKYLVYEWETLKVAARADVSVPTGDEDDLLGTGEWGGLLQMIASTDWGRFSPHVNIGVRLQTGDSELNGMRYLVGCDARLTERLSVSVDYLGTDDFDNDGIGDRTHALSTGVKLNPVGRLVLTGNVLWRLDDRGLRADWVPSVSIEYTFD